VYSYAATDFFGGESAHQFVDLDASTIALIKKFLEKFIFVGDFNPFMQFEFFLLFVIPSQKSRHLAGLCLATD
jgi:hypothetical protein